MFWLANPYGFVDLDKPDLEHLMRFLKIEPTGRYHVLGFVPGDTFYSLDQNIQEELKATEVECGDVIFFTPKFGLGGRHPLYQIVGIWNGHNFIILDDLARDLAAEKLGYHTGPTEQGGH